MTTISAARITIQQIPGLDPVSPFTPVAERTSGGIPQVRLPSGHLALHVTRYDDVQQVLTDPSFLRSSTNTEEGPSFLPTIMPPELLLNLDVPDHARMRRFVTADYSTAGVERLKPAVDDVLTTHLAAMREQERPDLYAAVLDRFPAAVNGRFLGIPDQDISYYRPLARTVQIASHDDVPKLVSDFEKLYVYLLDLVAGRRAVEPGGLIDRFVSERAAAEPPLADEELVGLLLGSLLGADQNILSVAAKIMYVLLAAPALWRRLAAEPEIAPRLAEELIRLIPLGNISAFPRIAGRDVRIADGLIKEGEVVYPDAFAANRDPRAFPEPLVIDPDRVGKRHLQFGYGMHHCMGAALARLEIGTLLERLAREFPGLELAVAPEELPWDSGTVLRRPVSLPVRW